jgi:hypothetical protein
VASFIIVSNNWHGYYQFAIGKEAVHFLVPCRPATSPDEAAAKKERFR